MKYYEMHNEAYKQLDEKDYITWGRKKNISEILEHEMNTEIKAQIDNYFPSAIGLTALDIGTGTGVTAFYLEKLGFKVDAFDVAPKAIEMAKKNAKKLNSNVSFNVGDITQNIINKKYNFIVDSCCLHCIVTDEDRDQFYQTVKTSLKECGTFFLFTMTASENMSFLTDKKHLILKDTYLYSEGPDRWDMDWKEVDGRKVFLHRRILRDEQLLVELKKHGFKIQHQYKTIDDPNSTYNFIAWLTLK